MNINRINKQSGLTIIELMVAMVIGLFLLLGISSVYISNVKTSKARDQFSLLEDNARLALNSMTNVIQHTGFSTGQNRIILPNKFITAEVNPDSTCSAGHALFTANEITKDAVTGDSIGTVYFGNAPVFAGGAVVNIDCSGLTLPAPCQLDNPANTSTDNTKSHIYNTFFLENDGTLQCVGSLSSKKQLIAEGIENMQVTYGVDTDGSGTANKYVNASGVGGAWWSGVVSVQIAVLVKSEKAVKDQAEQKTYALLDESVTAPLGAGAKDRFQRAVFSTTIHLRNN